MTRIALDQLVTDAGTQARAQIDPERVALYAQAMQVGDPFPPLKAIQTGEALLLIDGFTRLAAARQLGLTDFDVDVSQGDQRAALWESYGGNRSNGLPLSNEDKRRVVDAILDDDEYRARSNHDIGRHVGATATFVGGRRDLWHMNHPDVPRSTLRAGADGRTIDTAKIGRSATPAAVLAVAWKDVPKTAVAHVSLERLRQLAALSWIDRYKTLAREIGDDAILVAITTHGQIVLRECAKAAASVFEPPLKTVNTEYGEAVFSDLPKPAQWFTPLLTMLVTVKRVAVYQEPSVEADSFYFKHQLRLRQAASEAPAPPADDAPAPGPEQDPAADLESHDSAFDWAPALGDRVAVDVGADVMKGRIEQLRESSADVRLDNDQVVARPLGQIRRAPEDDGDPAPQPLAAGDRVVTRANGFGTISVINGAHARIQLERGRGFTTQEVATLQRAAPPANGQQSAPSPAPVQPVAPAKSFDDNLFADLAPLPWVHDRRVGRQREIADATGGLVCTFAAGLEDIAGAIVQIVNVEPEPAAPWQPSGPTTITISPPSNGPGTLVIRRGDQTVMLRFVPGDAAALGNAIIRADAQLREREARVTL